MAPNDPSKDPRMKVVTKALQQAAGMEGMLANFQSRGKTAIGEIKEALKTEKDKKAHADLKEVAKKIATLVKDSSASKKEFDKMLGDFNDLKKQGNFQDFSENLITRAASMQKSAIQAADYRKFLAGVSFKKDDLSKFASLRGLENYSENYLAYYSKFAPLVGKLKGMKGDDPDPSKDPRMKVIESALTSLGSLDGMLGNFETRGRAALGELKALTKKEKDKTVVKDLKTTSDNIDALMKGAKNAQKEVDEILKEYNALKKDGQVDEFLVKLKDRPAAARATLQHVATFKKGLEKVKFDAKDLKTVPSLTGLRNYGDQYEKYAADFFADLKKAKK